MARKGKPRRIALQVWANCVIEQEKQIWGDWPVRFAFKYFHADHSKLCGKGMDSDRTRAMFRRLKEYESKTWREMHNEKAGTHFHPVDFSSSQRNEYKRGFRDQLTEDMMNLTPYQIAMTKKVRFFGVLYVGSFYVVWCDADHDIFPESI